LKQKHYNKLTHAVYVFILF